ncbi:discoidin domain-containing protein [Plantactinospora sp. KLBMP9567]|uniref:discoidin domain-containing protein n=1 Tax=Plantactinospora sp. KLBMP9567 TaxID=3085900 RepID=UPI002981F029|nr:discoidin domain-containing protein [Plantactinospora sp. KLBMP9567]MDW5323352.1 discoidin domain-containing protein [Plantactinospora sp. KLBMP9567]
MLLKEADAGEVIGGLLATVTSLGLLCLAEAVELCKDARKTTTDSTGTYTFRLTGRDTRGTFNTASTMAVSARLPSDGDTATGPAVQARFKVHRTALTVPPLTFWEPADLVVRADSSRVRFDWSGRPGPKDRKPPRYTVTATSGTGGDDVVWVADGVKPGGSLDARAIGDLRGRLHVTATLKVTDDGTEFTTLYDTQRVGLVGVLEPPQSRDAECAVAGRRGEPEPLVPCSLTDGRYGRPYRLRSCLLRNDSGGSPGPRATESAEPCRANTFVQIDLGVRRPITAVFAHGLSASSPVVIETSDDGITWSRQADAGEPRFLEVTLSPGIDARYLRLSQTDGNRVTRLNELAVWP